MSPLGVSVGINVAVGVKDAVKIGNTVAVEVGIRVSVGRGVIDGAAGDGRICCCTNMQAVMNSSVNTKNKNFFVIGIRRL